MPLSSQKALTLLSSLILIGLTSCGGSVSQCKQLASPINEAKGFVQEYEQDMDQALAQFSSAQNLGDINTAAKDYISAVEKARAQLDAFAQETSNASIDDEQLNEYRQQYVTLLTQWNGALTSARDAMQPLTEASTEEEARNVFSRFQAQTDSAYSAIQTIDLQEAALIEGNNAYCDASS